MDYNLQTLTIDEVYFHLVEKFKDEFKIKNYQIEKNDIENGIFKFKKNNYIIILKVSKSDNNYHAKYIKIELKVDENFRNDLINLINKKNLIFIKNNEELNLIKDQLISDMVRITSKYNELMSVLV